MVVNTNNSALVTNEALKNTSFRQNSSLEKLSTGLRVNKASDNASGLTIADQLRTQASSLNQSVENGNIAVTFLQIADKAMAEQSNILDTIKAKLIQAKTATTSDEGRTAIAKDISRLLVQLDNIAGSANYNDESEQYMLQASSDDQSPAGAFSFQLGEKAMNTIDLEGGKVQANTVGLDLVDLKGFQNSDQLTQEVAGQMMEKIDKALDQLNLWRSEYGSAQLQVQASTRNMMTGATNILDSESVIRDVDYANESANFSQENIISQTGAYALVQANSNTNRALQLLR